jgi:4-aminobutyrate aminotransferase/(S)-3-amino-2-methylpropionate transaminase
MHVHDVRSNSVSNQSLVERRSAAVARGLGMAAPVFVRRAANSEFWDVEDKRYIDFGGGIAVLNTGHRHPRVMRRVYEQLERYTHTCFTVTPYEPFVELAERLNALVPIVGDKKTLLVTTGAEAIENAIKIARAYTGRSGVLVFNGAFHGRTLLTMAMTGKLSPYKEMFGPFPGHIWRVPYPIPHKGVTVEDTFKALDWLFKTDVSPRQIAAVVVEPVQGEGGFYIAPREFMRRLRELCDRHGIVFIADEIQSGFGRTGRWFASEHFDVAPDLLTCAKSLAGGFPLAGVVGRSDIMDAAEPGGLGGTYAGNPVACAAALGVIEAIETEGLLAQATEIGAAVTSRLNAIKGKRVGRPIGDVRALGAMMAFELVTAHGGDEPDPAAAKKLVNDCLADGLLLLTCGVFADTVRLLMPLTIDPSVLGEGLDILERALVKSGVNH